MNPIGPIRPFVPPEMVPVPPVPPGSGLPGGPGLDGVREVSGLPSVVEGGGGVSGFDNVLGHFVQEVNGKHQEAGQALSGLFSGGQVSLHQAMIAMEEAGLSFRLMVEVRNKLLEAYQELMRMNV